MNTTPFSCDKEIHQMNSTNDNPFNNFSSLFPDLCMKNTYSPVFNSRPPVFGTTPIPQKMTNPFENKSSIPIVPNPFNFDNKFMSNEDEDECTSPVYPVFGNTKNNNPFSSHVKSNDNIIRLKAYIEMMEDEILYHTTRIEHLKNTISKMKDKIIDSNDIFSTKNMNKKQKF